MARHTAVPGSCYFYYPRLVCVVGVRDDARATTNFAPVTWASPLSSDPPLYGICVTPKTHTHHLILRSGEFTINFLGHEHGAVAEALGKLSGRTVNKVEALGLQLEAPETIATPSLAVAYVAAECLLRERHQFGDQTLFVGDVQQIVVQDGIFDEDGVLRVERLDPLLYLGNNRYVTTDPATAARVKPADPVKA